MWLHDERGKVYQLDAVLGRGGEATIWSVKNQRRLVAKIYQEPSKSREDKLRTMVARRPIDPVGVRGHISICWPQILLFNQHRSLVGFLMPRIDLVQYRELFKISTPSTRQSEAPGVTWAYLAAAAESIAIVVGAVHKAGYVIGDVNESNFFISARARACIVDCDSMQVATQSAVYMCTVAKPEYLAPELHHANLSSRIRSKAEDNFALAVLIFQLLMEGVHPYAGKWRGSGDPPPIDTRIACGDSPYGNSPRILPSPIAPPFQILPEHLQQLFIRAFVHGNSYPSRRPSAQEWQLGLRTLRASLITCVSNSHHLYSGHLARCPWCDRTVMFGFDAYPRRRNVWQLRVPSQILAETFERSLGAASLQRGSRIRAGIRHLLLNKKVLTALVFTTPLLSAQLSALSATVGSNGLGRIPFITAAIASLLGCARALQTHRYHHSIAFLMGAVMFGVFCRPAWSHFSAFCMVLQAVLTFLSSRFMLQIFRSLLERLRDRARVTAIASILVMSLLFCPIINLIVALMSPLI